MNSDSSRTRIWKKIGRSMNLDVKLWTAGTACPTLMASIAAARPASGAAAASAAMAGAAGRAPCDSEVPSDVRPSAFL
eukprot:CAMPEP_0203965554 /NCGR_PEP_ID=MMETSP0359-20131031/95013_1 /ASSEMBLY_ACC=CAM_ASM_000338 /TAXON_ID=268821 /ORGANISM="Scrippsiella Hangoei, Strain SHTV-5" /LENGTH=77 /DNA_ID=CAMNT_0050902503 /DNA_START=320 /DNA_END=550 /DNA_ORIENTATION=-